MLKKYLPLFYPDVNDKYNIIIDFLFKSFLEKEEQQELICKQSCSVLLQEIKRLNIPTAIFTPYLRLFEEQIKKTTKPFFFECLCEINIKLASTSIDMELFKILCKILYLRIYDHLKKKNQKHKNPYEHLIYKCFNVIQIMLTKQNETFIKTNEEKISECISYIYKFKKYYDEELIILIGNFIRGINKIPSTIEKLTKNLMANLDNYIKNNGMTIHSYKMINCYIEYGTNTQQLDQYINKFFKLGMYEDKEQISPFYMCSLLQIWMMNKEIKDVQCFENVVNFVIDKLIYLSSFDSFQQNDQYNYSAFLTLMYVSLAKDFNCVLNLLNKKNKNDDILFTWNNKFLLFNISCSYQFKIMILAITEIANNLIQKMSVPKLLTFGIHVLIKQCDNEIAKRKNKQKIYSIKTKKDNEYLQTNYNEKREPYEIQKIKEMVSCTINKLETIDEFAKFKQVIHNFEQINKSGFNQWLGELSGEDQDKLYRISEVKRVKIESSNNIEQVPRRIVKVIKKEVI